MIGEPLNLSDTNQMFTNWWNGIIQFNDEIQANSQSPHATPHTKVCNRAISFMLNFIFRNSFKVNFTLFTDLAQTISIGTWSNA